MKIKQKSIFKIEGLHDIFSILEKIYLFFSLNIPIHYNFVKNLKDATFYGIL